MPDLESNVLLVVNGMMRSGTIWFTRLLADSLNVASRTLYHDPPHTDTKLDSAIWHFERPGKFIRRLHYFTFEYPYSVAVPQVIIVRDVRDTLVSQADFYLANVGKTQALSARADWLLPKWSNFYKAWAQDEHCRSLVRYEDLLASPVAEIERVLSDLGLSAPRPDIEQAIAIHAFSKATTQNTNAQKGSYGTSGSFKTRFPPGFGNRVWEECGEVMEMMGYAR